MAGEQAVTHEGMPVPEPPAPFGSDRPRRITVKRTGQWSWFWTYEEGLRYMPGMAWTRRGAIRAARRAARREAERRDRDRRWPSQVIDLEGES